MRKLKKFKSSSAGKIGLAALLTVAVFVLFGGLYLFVQPAGAAHLSNKSDTLQSSTHNVLAQQTFLFRTHQILDTDGSAGADFSIVLNFPTDAGGDPFGQTVPDFAAGDVTVTATSCGTRAFAVTSVEETSNGGTVDNDEFQILVEETNTDSVDVPLNCDFTVVFGASSGAQRLTNPTNTRAEAGCIAGAGLGDADVCRVTIITTEDIVATATPTAVDTGDLLVALVEGVSVTASVAETLSFSIDAGAACTGDTGPAPTVRTATATTVPFGTLNADAFYVACQDLTISTNAGTGFNVTVEEDDQLINATSDTIPDTVCDAACTESAGAAWAVATANQGLGYTCENITGTPCDAAGDSFILYRQFADIAGAETAQDALSGTSAVAANIGRIHYKLSIPGTQPTGLYSNTITYIATGTF